MFREMRRQDKKLSMEECVKVLTEETRGVLSVLGDDDYPYAAPINHFYNEEDGKLYFHMGPWDGHRLNALKKHDKVCFCTMDKGYQEEGDWAWNVKSVIVFGRMVISRDLDLIRDIMIKLAHKFTDDDDFILGDIEAQGMETLLLVLTPDHISGKLVNES